MNVLDDMETLDNAKSAVDKAKIGLEEIKEEEASFGSVVKTQTAAPTRTLKRQADLYENTNKRSRGREIEKTKEAEALASDKIHKRTKDLGFDMNANKIKLTAQENEAVKRKSDFYDMGQN
nr:hypothetical protein [Tanacetum cinerariifolium]